MRVALNDPPPLEPGQVVRIVDGPFNDFIGTLRVVYPQHKNVRVTISFFGRETLVELDFLQVEQA
jgi:transcriptional antiterminator NusG